MLAGIVSPIIVMQHCYDADKSCYPQAYGSCAIVMILSLSLFVFGKKFYRIIAPSHTFMPFVAIRVIISGISNYYRAPREDRKNRTFISFARMSHSEDIIQEVYDLATFTKILYVKLEIL